MSEKYMKESDVYRSFIDYWDKGKTFGECLDAVPKYEINKAGEKKINDCPFCGGDAEIYCEENMYKPRCKNTHTCGCQIALWFDEPEDAIKAWNTAGTGGFNA